VDFAQWGSIFKQLLTIRVILEAFGDMPAPHETMSASLEKT
jgi:hypothetical protein